MSVVLAVKVSEGLVLASDSAATLKGQMEGADGSIREGILKTFYNVKKLLQIGDFPIGILTWGQAFVGARTVESLVREWEHEEGWESKEQYQEQNDGKFEVKACAESLREHVSEIYTEEYSSKDPQNSPPLGMIVAGYTERAFFPEIWRFVLPHDIGGSVHRQRPDQNGKPSFGASWFGRTDSIVRLHFGRDNKLIDQVSEKFDISKEELLDVLSPLEYKIPFDVMPLEEAIDFAYFMINVVIGRYKFAVGPEYCGGNVEIGAITRNKFEKLTKKPIIEE